MFSALLFPLAFGILNRARGCRFFGLLDSTTVSRILATYFMAALTVALAANDTGQAIELLLWTWAGLYLWSLPGWGKYAGAAIGGPLHGHEREFAPVDWLMARLPIKSSRLWGAVAMGLRMTLAAPCVLGIAYLTGGNAWWATATPLMGLVYLPCGLAFKKHQWMYAEHCAGAILGVIIFAIVFRAG